MGFCSNLPNKDFVKQYERNFIFSTILLGYQAKMVRIGIIVALSDTHFCILSRDCFNLSREYFSLWVIKNVTG